MLIQSWTPYRTEVIVASYMGRKFSAALPQTINLQNHPDCRHVACPAHLNPPPNPMIPAADQLVVVSRSSPDSSRQSSHCPSSLPLLSSSPWLELGGFSNLQWGRGVGQQESGRIDFQGSRATI